MTFPAEPVPDGAFFGPHHFIYPLYIVLLLYFIYMNDDPDSKPISIPFGAGIALFGWFHLWPFYPVTGTIAALIGVLTVIVGATLARDRSPKLRASVVVLGIVALDDWIDHAFHVDTPLSLVFSNYISQYMY